MTGTDHRENELVFFLSQEIEMSNYIEKDASNDGHSTGAGSSTCMAWAGAGLVWTMKGGIPTATACRRPIPAVFEC